MTGHRITLKGVRIKDGKVERVFGYGLSASAKIQKRKSKKARVVKRVPNEG
jgi:hypothetical protein